MRSPILLPSGGLISSTWVWSALPAQSTIPYDMMSASFLGFRFAKTTQRPSVICSIGTNSCSPEPIVRSYPSPRSIFSTYSFADSGCLVHSTILPTLRSQARYACNSSLRSDCTAATWAPFFGGFCFTAGVLAFFSVDTFFSSLSVVGYPAELLGCSFFSSVSWAG